MGVPDKSCWSILVLPITPGGRLHERHRVPVRFNVRLPRWLPKRNRRRVQPRLRVSCVVAGDVIDMTPPPFGLSTGPSPIVADYRRCLLSAMQKLPIHSAHARDSCPFSVSISHNGCAFRPFLYCASSSLVHL